MIEEFVKSWDKYKHRLEEYYRQTNLCKLSRYENIVTAVFDQVINPGCDGFGEFDTDKMVVIDNGDFQGTMLYILHRDFYQPTVENYVYTHNYYGSCSGCDTLLGICGYGDGLPDSNQVAELMTLSLHILQRAKYLQR